MDKMVRWYGTDECGTLKLDQTVPTVVQESMLALMTIPIEASEIGQTQYVCDGGSSNNTMLTSMVSSPPSNMGCDAGGRVISHGLDNGDGGGTYANGVLETGEIDSTTTFCSRFVSDDYNLKMVKDIYSGSSIIPTNSQP